MTAQGRASIGEGLSRPLRQSHASRCFLSFVIPHSSFPGPTPAPPGRWCDHAATRIEHTGGRELRWLPRALHLRYPSRLRDLLNTLNQISANTNSVEILDTTFADPDLEALRQKLNELILNGRR